MVDGGAVYKPPLKRGWHLRSKWLGIVRYSTRAQSPVSLSADSSFAKGAKVKDKARPTKDRAARVGAALRSKPRRPSYLARRLSRGSIRQRGTEDPLFGLFSGGLGAIFSRMEKIVSQKGQRSQTARSGASGKPRPTLEVCRRAGARCLWWCLSVKHWGSHPSAYRSRRGLCVCCLAGCSDRTTLESTVGECSWQSVDGSGHRSRIQRLAAWPLAIVPSCTSL